MNGKIAIGIIIFVVLVTSPYWYNMGKASVPPKLVVGTTEKACVEPTPYMKSSHMQLLNDWRDQAVREGKREYVSSTGKKFDISLQKHLHEVPHKEDRVLRPMPQLCECRPQMLGLPYSAFRNQRGREE